MYILTDIYKSIKQNKEPRNRCKHAKLIFGKDTKATQCKKDHLSNKWLW